MLVDLKKFDFITKSTFDTENFVHYSQVAVIAKFLVTEFYFLIVNVKNH